MALVKNLRESPPDDWRYLEPRSGIWIEGHFWSELVDKVVAHREYKQYEPWDRVSVELIVHRQICSVAAPGVCRPEPGEDYQPLKDQARIFTKETVLSASNAAIEWLKTGTTVPKKESERRAEICRGCRLNRPSPSWACAVLCKTLDAMVPEGRREPGMSLCGICQCSLAVKVLAPDEVIDASNNGRDLIFPQWCWQRRTE